MELDVQRYVRNKNNPELPSEAMQEEFESWEHEYTVDNLAELTVSQIESRKQRFDEKVQQLVMEHNPGRKIQHNPVLAASVGKPPYTSEEWEQARKMIWRKKDEISFRFDQAKGKVEKEKTESKMKRLERIADSVAPDSINISLF